MIYLRAGAAAADPGSRGLARLQGLARGVELWFWLVWDEGGGQGAGRASGGSGWVWGGLGAVWGVG